MEMNLHSCYRLAMSAFTSLGIPPINAATVPRRLLTFLSQRRCLFEQIRHDAILLFHYFFFVNVRYLDWTRGAQDVNVALSHNKPLVSILFDKSHWYSECHELGSLLKDHSVCLDLSAGSGSALSHQYDQGQVSALISHCNGILYGTGDIHPPEPPRTPEHEAQVKHKSTSFPTFSTHTCAFIFCRIGTMCGSRVFQCSQRRF